jgi:hypothetical protein
MKLLDALFFLALIATFVACPVYALALVRFIKNRSDQALSSKPMFSFPYRASALVAVPVLVLFATGIASTTVARRDALDFLQQPTSRLHVYVNGVAVENSEPIILCLRSIRRLPAHHSYPTTRIGIEIRGEGRRTLMLTLGRDSERPSEYWVFSDASQVTRDNEIGRVVSLLFDQY